MSQANLLIMTKNWMIIPLLFLKMGGFVYAQTIPVQWGNLTNIVFNGNNKTVQKTASGNNWDAWARSLNQFDENKEAVLKYTVDNNYGLLIGMGDLTSVYNLSVVKHGFKVETNQVYFIANGVQVGNVAKQTGMQLSLVRKQENNGNWKVNYLVNGTNQYSANTNSSTHYAYALVSKQNAIVTGVEAGNFPLVKKRNSICPGSTGRLEILANGGVPPYSFQWNNGTNTNTLENLVPANYAFTISDAGGNQMNSSTRIYYNLNWSAEQYAATTDNSITRNVGTTGSAAGLTRNKVLPGQSGNILFKVKDQNGIKSIGFSPSNTNLGTFVEAGFYIINDKFSFYQNGQSLSQSVTFPVGAQFEITKSSGGGFRYFVNGNLVGSKSGSSSATYVLNALVNSLNSGFKDMEVNFCSDEEQQKQCARLKRKLDGVRYKTSKGRLHFSYEEEYNARNTILNYKIYSTTNRVLPIIDGSGQNKPLKYGDNRYQVNVTSLSAGAYVLEVENDKKEKFYLRFIK